MLTFILISLAVALAWAIKDWIELKVFPAKNWNKYVGCIVAGILYSLLKTVTFFEYIFEVGTIVLVAYCWQAIWTFLSYLYAKIKPVKK